MRAGIPHLTPTLSAPEGGEGDEAVLQNEAKFGEAPGHG